MTESTAYKVRFENVPDTERLIFKLVFSISEKATGRPYKYLIADDNELDNADIIVSSFADVDVMDTEAGKVWLVDRGTAATEMEFVIERPLIATRVLVALDRFIDVSLADAQAVANQETTVKEPDDDIIQDHSDIEFCITEEEASELAIVDDETLSNPANKQTEQSEAADNAPSFERVPNVSSLVAFQRSPVDVAEKEITVTEAVNDKPRALVVDDSASVRKQIELELNLFEVEVDFAESFEQTMELLNKNQYDLAFLDVVLPDGDGFQICKTIKQTRKATDVIMLTGKATAADKIKGTMVGCDAYLVKPVGRMTFQNTVCNYLKLKGQHEVMNA